MRRLMLFCVAVVMLMPLVAGARQAPTRILVAYHSQTGNTEKLAQAIRDGARAVAGVEVTLQKVAEVKDDTIPSYDGLVIGTPVHWANISTESRKFLDRLGNALAATGTLGEGRTAGVFCTGGGESSGKEMARLSMISSLLEMRFVIIGGVDGAAYGTLGPQATAPQSGSGPGAAALEEARQFGQRFARTTRQFRAGETRK